MIAQDPITFMGLASILTPERCKRPCKSAESVARQRRLIWKRDQRFGFILCHWCQCAMTKDAWTRDHVQALAFGGRNHTCNIVAACEACNAARAQVQARQKEALRLGWLLEELRTA